MCIKRNIIIYVYMYVADLAIIMICHVLENVTVFYMVYKDQSSFILPVHIYV